jgi:hypothetical protein
MFHRNFDLHRTTQSYIPEDGRQHRSVSLMLDIPQPCNFQPSSFEFTIFENVYTVYSILCASVDQRSSSYAIILLSMYLCNPSHPKSHFECPNQPV